MSKSPRTVEQYLESWSPVDLARWIEAGLVDTTPLGFTAAGWRRLRAARAQDRGSTPRTDPVWGVGAREENCRPGTNLEAGRL